MTIGVMVVMIAAWIKQIYKMPQDRIILHPLDFCELFRFEPLHCNARIYAVKHPLLRNLLGGKVALPGKKIMYQVYRRKKVFAVKKKSLARKVLAARIWFPDRGCLLYIMYREDDDWWSFMYNAPFPHVSFIVEVYMYNEKASLYRVNFRNEAKAPALQLLI